VQETKQQLKSLCIYVDTEQLDNAKHKIENLKYTALF